MPLASCLLTINAMTISLFGSINSIEDAPTDPPLCDAKFSKICSDVNAVKDFEFLLTKNPIP